MTAPLIPGNRITLLESGTAYFPALIAAIDSAQQLVHLETYIYKRDETGEHVTRSLIAAARRGVKVRVVVDGFGGRDFVDDSMPQLQENGVEVLIYRREVAVFAFRRHRLRRLHRKLAAIDGRIAFVGGLNIIDDMDTPNQVPPRYDYAVSIEGPLVTPITDTMRSLWHLVSWVSFKRRPHFDRLTLPPPQPAGSVRAALVLRDNLRHRNEIEAAYLTAVNRARKEVLIANAYFLPGRRFRAALLDAAERGVKVTLLLQGRVEYWLLHHACRALYPLLLGGGVNIVEYRKSFLHAKVAVVDEDWATVGSSNIDPFSLLLAREANVVVRDQHFTQQLRSSLERAMADGGHRLNAADWQGRPIPSRMLSWLAYGTVRALIGLAGYAKQL